MRLKILFRNGTIAAVLAIFLYGTASLYLQACDAIPKNFLWRPTTASGRESNFFQGRSDYLQLSRATLWEPRPGARAKNFTINLHGLRVSAPITNKDKRPRIVVLGDSTTFAQDTEEPVTWPLLLERLAKVSRVDLEVLNCSVPAFTSVQCLAWYQSRIAYFDPDIIIVATTGYFESSTPIERTSDEELISLSHSRVFGLKLFLNRFGTLRYFLGPPTVPHREVAATERVSLDAHRRALSAFAELQTKGSSPTKNQRFVFVSLPISPDATRSNPRILEYIEATQQTGNLFNIPAINLNQFEPTDHVKEFSELFRSEMQYSNNGQYWIASRLVAELSRRFVQNGTFSLSPMAESRPGIK
ncbi:MAG: hypothetical protein ACKVS6_12120 [Planctomycetota bacterium]